jgi:hypothetical protein
MIENLYRTILRKLELSQEQLGDVKKLFAQDKICHGPFVKGDKRCPNTSALAQKENIDNDMSSGDIRRIFKKYDIVRKDLWMFYFLYDIPAMLSNKWASILNKKLEKVIKSMI